MPIVLISLLLIVQVGLVVRDALALMQAAREGARALAITGSDAEAEGAVRESAGPLDAAGIDVAITPAEGERSRGAATSVELRYVDRLRIPIVSRVVALDLPLRASATMRLERSVPTASPSP